MNLDSIWGEFAHLPVGTYMSFPPFSPYKVIGPQHRKLQIPQNCEV